MFLVKNLYRLLLIKGHWVVNIHRNFLWRNTFYLSLVKLCIIRKKIWNSKKFIKNLWSENTSFSRYYWVNVYDVMLAWCFFPKITCCFDAFLIGNFNNYIISIEKNLNRDIFIFEIKFFWYQSRNFICDNF